MYSREVADAADIRRTKRKSAKQNTLLKPQPVTDIIIIYYYKIIQLMLLDTETDIVYNKIRFGFAGNEIKVPRLFVLKKVFYISERLSI